MYFYRLIKPFKAITFDLDDTLYDNKPVIDLAEKNLVKFLIQSHPNLKNFNHKYYKFCKSKLLLNNPCIYYDINFWRKLSIKLSLRIFKINSIETNIIAKKAMKIANFWRNKVFISENTHRILNKLSKKFPLIAITNGDLDINKCNLNKYFLKIFRSGKDGYPKPFSDMYDLSAKKLKLSPHHILHVGDSLETDVFGSIRYGMQSCWVNFKKKKIISDLSAKTLPHFEISDLKYLMNFI
ncbi:yigB [Wigglesworthia glossinidia endosymbiont of Glossina brevipalpis]|uniref:YigB protein n=1 Tax=Wigglesworthia glossinidia brevipalpis TaxID=36870 RepID=Q8D2T3_WIGBR|nr:yigB [Wigglesworthia glossinidia endosymbiont of Glossina brevipalpis]